jgi:hypothetical protein
MEMPIGRWAVSGIAAAAVAGVVLVEAADGLSLAESGRLQQKIAAIAGLSGAAARPPAVRTAVTETELNSYLKYALGDQMPPGVTDATVSMEGAGRLSGRAIVDLSRAREGRSGGVFDPLTYLSGRLPVTATGVLHTRNGTGTFELESASVSSVPIPKSVLQEIVTIYSRSASRPEGLKLDSPFALPAGIREIEITPGGAVIVQ